MQSNAASLSRRGFVQTAAGAAAGALVLGAAVSAGSAQAAEVAGAADAAAEADDAVGSEDAVGAQAATVAMRPGVYVGTGRGFDPVAPVQVKIVVDETSLLSVEVIEKEMSREEPNILKVAETRMVPRMVEAQSLAVDSVTGATGSCAGIKLAVRDALVKALVAGGSPEDAVAAFDVAVEKAGGSKSLSYDVVVCGMGGAGCAAAMAVAESQQKAGLPVSVLAVETAGKYGGTAAEASEAFSVNAPMLCAEYNGGENFCDYDSLYDAWVTTYTQGTPCKPECVKLLMDESGATVDWLQYDHGFLFSRAKAGFGNNPWCVKTQYINATNLEADYDYTALKPGYTFADRFESVFQYYDAIVSDYVAAGGEYLLETTCTELVLDEGGAVKGVKAVDNVTGEELTVEAKAVILCTGGFGGSGDLEERFLTNPVYPYAAPWKLIGCMQNKGQMIASAVDQGAGTYNIDMAPCVHNLTTAYEMTDYPVYYRDGKETVHFRQNSWSLNDVPMILGMSSACLQVGTDGVRHFNEAGLFEYMYGGPTCYTILGSDYIDGLAETGFAGEAGTYTSSNRYTGQGGYPNARPIPQVYEVMETAEKRGFVYIADSLAELAEKMGVPAEDFEAQVERYRQFCASGVDEEFGKDASKLVDNLTGSKFYAIEMNAAPYATPAALDVDTQVRVLKSDGETPVAGLYACGNDSGGVLYAELLPYSQYGGVALGWAFTSGRLAGENAVAYLASL